MTTAKKNAKKIMAKNVGIYMHMGRYTPADTNKGSYVHSYKYSLTLS